MRRTRRTYMLFWAATLLVMCCPVSAASAQSPTNTPDWQPIYQTATPLPPGYYDCPSSYPDGWGTATPSALWQLRCGHCRYSAQSTPQATPTPQATATPVNGWYIMYVGYIDLADVDNSSYWGPTQYKTISIGYTNHEMVFAVEVMFQREPLFQTEIDGIGNINNDNPMNKIKLSGNPDIYYNNDVKSYLTMDLLERTGKQSVYTANGHGLGVSQDVIQISYHARDEWGRLNLTGQKLHVYILNRQVPYPQEREYVVTYNTENNGKVRLSCTPGDTPLGAMVGVAVQGGGIVTSQTAYTRIYDTGYTPLLQASVVCESFECAGSDYETTLGDVYPYARLSQAQIPASVIVDTYADATLQRVHNANLHCYGTGNGSVTNLDSYCAVIDPALPMPEFGLSPVYRDDSCIMIDPVEILDITIPGIEMCARTVRFGMLDMFGLSVDLNVLAVIMGAVAGLYIILRG